MDQTNTQYFERIDFQKILANSAPLFFESPFYQLNALTYVTKLLRPIGTLTPNQVPYRADFYPSLSSFSIKLLVSPEPDRYSCSKTLV